jgi:DNA-binding SARP family transcriptional activator
MPRDHLPMPSARAAPPKTTRHAAATPVAAATVRLLGDPAVLLPAAPARALERRAAGLLALVALEPGVTRARAAALLWPESDNARRALRQQILRFRTNYGAELVRGDDALSLSDFVSTDAHGAPTPDAGVLLGALSFDDCSEFAAWLAQHRQQRRDHTTAQLGQQLAAAEASGDLPTAVAAAQQMLLADNDSEEHYRTLMRLHYLRGDSAQAQAVYVRLVRHLSKRFGARPSVATEQLAQAVRSALATPRLPAAVQRPVPVTLLRPPRMIGRHRELSACDEAWANDRVVLLQGEPGLGKTRLLAEFGAGRRVISVQGRPGDAGVPYATLARLLRTILECAPIELPPPRRTALSRLLPELAPTLPLLADGQRLLLQQAVETVLTQAQVENVLSDGVVVDDLHFADAASVEMLQALICGSGVAAPGLRWMLAQRPGEGDASATNLRAALEEAQRLNVIALAPLSTDEMATLIDSLGLPELDSAQLAPQLARHTGGNPLYALETLKQGLTSGLIQHGRLPTPVNVGALIERRLKLLPERALSLARVAAIAGVDFSIALAEHVMGVRAVDLADAWGDLETAQVLRENAFAHDLVYDAVLRSVPEAIARHLHAQCAGWLASRGGEPARVAEHWLQGGEPGRAGEAFVAAAVRAEAAARIEDKAVLLQRAADAFEAAGATEQRFSALTERVAALRDLNFGEEGLQAALGLQALAATDAQRLQALQVYVGMLAERGEAELTIETGQPALALAARLGEHASAVRLACHMASALCRLGRAAEALAVLRPQREWIEQQGDPALTVLWFGDWAAALGWSGRIREATAAYDVAIAAARQAGLRDSEGRLVMNCAVTLRQSGQFDRALALAQQGRALSADESDDVTHRLIAQLVVARDEAETGRYESALAALERILPKFEASGADFWAQASRMVLAQLWMHVGQFARAVPLLRDEPEGMPAWLRADRLLLQRELALATRQPLSDAVRADALALVQSDGFRGPAMRVRALRGLPAREVLSESCTLQATLLAQERFGALMALQVHVARAALDESLHDEALAAANTLLLRFEEGYAPDSMYRAEAWLVAHQALLAAGQRAEAERALEQGRRWVRHTVLPQVPAAFIDSFLHRNAVNASLLAATSLTR